ncbi:Mur ligase family protein [Geosporobacter ferrireducens]|uniref:Mur ligase family protein n=1 Tax=Geosporobacter ferrireducens TaxID=1424294 RepID=UPI0023530301|nr:Mur ligase family protein [Geosporobacter ferrireducens]
MSDHELQWIENTSGLREWIDIKNRRHDYPSEKLRFIGVLEANEKTVTAQMMAYMLESSGFSVDIKNTTELFYNTTGEENHLFMLEEYFEYLQEQVKKKKDIIIFQMNTDFIKAYPLLQTPFDVFIHTMLGMDSISIGEELKEKIESSKVLINHLPKESIIAVNMDDCICTDFLEVLKDRMVITYGLSAKATVTASSIETTPFLKFYCCIQRGITTKNGIEIEPLEFPVEIKLAEKNNVYSVLAAATGVMVFGVPPDGITSEIFLFSGEDRRIENEKKIYISY